MRSLSSPPGRPPRFRRWRQDGYNLVVLMVMFSVMSILMAKALPQWSTRIQREQERELIFRGLQYAEAIRVFQIRHNRAPVRLRELVEVEPRAIRQLWNNPLDPDSHGKPPEAIGWEPIFQGMPDTPGQQEGDDEDDEDDGSFGSGAFGEQEGEVRVGPILGVRSKVGGDSFRVFLDAENVRDWRFTQDLFQPRPTASSAGALLPPNADEIGRPWPEGVTPQMGIPPGNEGTDATRAPTGDGRNPPPSPPSEN